MPPPIVIALASNQSYFPGLYCTVASLLLHSAPERPVDLYVLDGGVTGASKDLLQSAVNSFRSNTTITWIPVAEEQFSYAVRGPGNSRMAYVRLLLPDLVGASRCLYLDSDILVLRDVSELYDLELGNGILLGAVLDHEIQTLGKDAPQVADALNLSGTLPYYNSGVLLMNLDGLREWGFTSNTLKFLKEWGSKCRFWDQSAINYCCAGRIRTLPEVWNYPSWQFDSNVETCLRCLLHFTGSVPWFGGYPGPAQALYERFADEVRQPVEKQSVRFWMTRLKWINRSVLAPLRAVGYPVAAVLCRILKNHSKALEYGIAADYWIRYLAQFPARRRSHRKRILAIKTMCFLTTNEVFINERAAS